MTNINTQKKKKFLQHISWTPPTALSCSNRSFIFQTYSTPLNQGINQTILKLFYKTSPSPCISQPAVELAVRHKPNANKKEDKTPQKS